MKPLSQKQIAWMSVVLGASYGLFVRYMFGFHFGGDPHSLESHPVLSPIFDVMSVSFIFGAPFALGFITVWFGEMRERFSWPKRIFMPWLAVLACLSGCLILAWEGIICVVLWLPVAFVLSSFGGIFAWLAGRIFRNDRSRMSCVAVVALFPFLSASLESYREHVSEIRKVDTSIEINATPTTVWNQIKTVPPIADSEQSFDFSHLMGFPRPTEAVIHGEGVGAVRYARFEGNVLFLETVTVWKPDEELAFTIHADTKNIPPTTFDEHVTIGGPYFDVLNGVYRIERLANGRVLLRLSSEQRLSTRFNAYSHLWTEWLMADLQNYILRIIKKRCEAPAASKTPLSPRSHGDRPLVAVGETRGNEKPGIASRQRRLSAPDASGAGPLSSVADATLSPDYGYRGLKPTATSGRSLRDLEYRQSITGSSI